MLTFPSHLKKYLSNFLGRPTQRWSLCACLTCSLWVWSQPGGSEVIGHKGRHRYLIGGIRKCIQHKVLFPSFSPGIQDHIVFVGVSRVTDASWMKQKKFHGVRNNLPTKHQTSCWKSEQETITALHVTEGYFYTKIRGSKGLIDGGSSEEPRSRSKTWQGKATITLFGRFTQITVRAEHWFNPSQLKRYLCVCVLACTWHTCTYVPFWCGGYMWVHVGTLKRYFGVCPFLVWGYMWVHVCARGIVLMCTGQRTTSCVTFCWDRVFYFLGPHHVD